jgi:hypothetical protein
VSHHAWQVPEHRGVVAEISVADGSALALAYEARRSTRNVDAVVQPARVIREAAATVAGKLG